MAWSSIPKSHRPDYDAMEKQQWQPKRARSYSSPSRPVVRGKRGLAILTSMLLVVVIFVTTASFRPSYTEKATTYGKSATAYGLRKWKETEEKLMGSWNVYEEENFPTSNPQVISATNDRYEEHISEPHPGFKGIGGVNNIGDSELQPESKAHVQIVQPEAEPEINSKTGTYADKAIHSKPEINTTPDVVAKPEINAMPEVNVKPEINTNSVPSEPAVGDLRALGGIASHQEESSTGPTEQINSLPIALGGVAS